MEIRRATLADVNSILELWKAADAVASSTDSTAYVERAVQYPSAAFLLAIVDGNVIGSLLGGFDGWRGNMYRLAVHPNYRRQGIARNLVRQVEQIFAEWGVTRVTALVERDRFFAGRFWESVGYPQDEHLVRHVGALDSRTA
jgi:ribosomal protein S18 acetylase RimI-like enzyme